MARPKNYLPWAKYRKWFMQSVPPPDPSQGNKNFKPLCTLCKENKSASITCCSNLRKHMQKCHLLIFEADKDDDDDADEDEDEEGLSGQPTPKKRKQSSTKCSPKKFGKRSIFTPGRHVSQSRLDELVLNVVIENRLPFRFVESKSTRELIAAIVPPSCTLLREKTLRSRVLAKLQSMKAALKTELASVSTVSTTADAWKTRGRGYVAVTAHWLKSDTLERRSAALALRRIEGTQDYDAIANVLESIFSEYELDNSKISSVVTDNGSNFCKAFRVYGVRDVDEVGGSDQEDGDWEDVEVEEVDLAETIEQSDRSVIELPTHRRCASHTLSRIAVYDVEGVLGRDTSLKHLHDSVMSKCSALWRYQSRSTNGHDKIKSVLGTLLPTPNETRWNSKFDALSHILKLTQEKAPELRELITSRTTEYFTPNEITWMKEYKEVMQPLADALDILQQENNVCIGYLLPTLHRLLQTQSRLLEGRGTNGLRYLKPVAQSIRDSVRRRFNSGNQRLLWNQELVVAACLVPALRLNWVRDFVEDGPAKVEQARQWVLDAAKDLEEECDSQAQQTLEITPEEESEARNSFRRLFGFSQNSNKRLASSCSASEVLNRFLSGDASAESDKLYRKIFIKFNTCIPSSAPVERFFSRAKLVMVPGRNRLGDKNFESLVLLEANSSLF
ncbi:Putative AC9 transposase [Frankliniella fusca]|uniref:AC9 transposase n=1 Tax=Frankliniella fusca TaxID=407009 RepID=A0AAE1HSF4_9NEOP|nr:Putative AC9 transposase [Frankliniella fusca]